MKDFVLALDQGTTSSRAIVFNHDGVPVATAQKEFTQIYPKPGWVEHNPEEIWSTITGFRLLLLGIHISVGEPVVLFERR